MECYELVSLSDHLCGGMRFICFIGYGLFEVVQSLLEGLLEPYLPGTGVSLASRKALLEDLRQIQEAGSASQCSEVVVYRLLVRKKMSPFNYFSIFDCPQYTSVMLQVVVIGAICLRMNTFDKISVAF